MLIRNVMNSRRFIFVKNSLQYILVCNHGAFDNNIVAHKVVLQATGGLDVNEIVLITVLHDFLDCVILRSPVEIRHRLVNVGEEMLGAHGESLTEFNF